ncbi:MAG: endonuclease III, partial [Halobacteriales archaeon]
AFESLVRTVLSQNTSDQASQPAHDALMERYGPADELAENLAAADREELAETIRPAGLYNRKSRTLQRLAERVTAEYGGVPDDRIDAGVADPQEDGDVDSRVDRDADPRSGGDVDPLTPAEGFDAFVRREEPAEVRTELLEMDGVGPKTADCVLLFAGGREGVFPVDTHVHRIYRRIGIAPPDADHEDVREVLEADVPPEKCGFGHTASIQFGREYCTARKPACLDGPDACPMYDLCDRVGVYPGTGEVVDPADAGE